MIEAIVTNYATLIDEYQEQKRQAQLILLEIILLEKQTLYSA